MHSKVNKCVFYKAKMVYMLYTDDSKLVGPNKRKIKRIVKKIKKACLGITEKGNIEDFLGGLNIDQEKKGKVTLTQPHLINQILANLQIKGSTIKGKDIPEMSFKILG